MTMQWAAVKKSYSYSYSCSYSSSRREMQTSTSKSRSTSMNPLIQFSRTQRLTFRSFHVEWNWRQSAAQAKSSKSTERSVRGHSNSVGS